MARLTLDNVHPDRQYVAHVTERRTLDMGGNDLKVYPGREYTFSGAILKSIWDIADLATVRVVREIKS